LARMAVNISVTRHGGVVERIYSPTGYVDVLKGKDLRGIKTIVGVGGVLVNSAHAAGAILDLDHEGLLPMAPRLMLDSNYIMAAAGLLAEIRPDLAARLLTDSLAAL